jgi:hypothetical protein
VRRAAKGKTLFVIKNKKRGNWIQTDPAKGWFAILRLYSPFEPFFTLEPFFTKEWRPSEIELVR